MRLDLFTAWLQRCLADFTKDHDGEEHELLEWLDLLYDETTGRRRQRDDRVDRVDQLLLVTATTRPGARGPDEEPEEPGYCLGLRFCSVQDVVRVEKLLVTQIRKHYSVYTGMTPKEVRRALHFTVWAVPNPPKRGGWPRWLGPTGYYV